MRWNVWKEVRNSHDLPTALLYTSSHRTSLVIVGPLLKSISDSMLKKREEPSSPSIFKVYSGHDTTLAVLLNTLKIYDGVPPPYSAAVFIELRLKDGHYYVTVSFQKRSNCSKNSSVVLSPSQNDSVGSRPQEWLSNDRKISYRCRHRHLSFSGAIQDFGHGAASSAGASQLQKPVQLGSIH